MTNVMSKAWEIAKEGQKKFGGKVTEYISEALRMAWAIVKKGVVKMYATLKTLTGSNKHKTWVAKIKGTHPKFKFDREFIEEMENDFANKFWRLYNGNIYEVCDGGNKFFVKVDGGEIIEINSQEVSAQFA